MQYGGKHGRGWPRWFRVAFLVFSGAVGGLGGLQAFKTIEYGPIGIACGIILGVTLGWVLLSDS